MNTHHLLRVVVAACALVGASGCFKATFRDPGSTAGTVHEEWRNRFLVGLVGDGEVDARKFCPDGRIAEVRTGGNAATSAATIFTLFIYSPRKVYVTCAAAGATARAEAAAGQAPSAGGVQ